MSSVVDLLNLTEFLYDASQNSVDWPDDETATSAYECWPDCNGFDRFSADFLSPRHRFILTQPVSFFKMREISLRYTFPAGMLSGGPFRTISIVALDQKSSSVLSPSVAHKAFAMFSCSLRTACARSTRNMASPCAQVTHLEWS